MTGSFAHLRKESPFYPIFPSGAVPIPNILVPSRAECEGDGIQDVFIYWKTPWPIPEGPQPQR